MSARRNFSMQSYWNRKFEDWKPLLAFRGRSRNDWRTWRKKALPKLLELLGDFPKPVPLQAEVEYSVTEGDLVRERVVLNSEAFMSVPCLLLKPRRMAADRKQAAILCSHGHGLHGKDAVAGFRSSAAVEQNIAAHNYNYAEQMARAGFITLAPDLRVFGERRDGADPFPGRDPCNINFLKGAMLGVYTLTLNIWDMKCCVDYLQTRPEVDPDRIGMMGLSQGGTMTTFTTAVEPRIRAADIIGYVNSWRGFAIERANWCGSQMVPNLYRYFDTDDIAGLIAPRPLLLEMGIYDTCFFIQDQLEGYRGVERIYRAAEAAADLWTDIHPGPHAFSGRRAFDFFKKYL
ncbi:MAG TPA: alpha/beta hydrolase family protein [bacterium]|uniref:Abhydrolase family protein n=1 Tax=candidate division TA06 bacterium ADurb.Bin417 TaxID=1852828 RepID=A0A1V5MGJ9_UNCT6|nr:MAG: Abhydrolase family protein [candidate division TA06 bacterium ADurb.Bin417]HNQ34953.1 alpha/beta hydrolase family protein [bacterium]HNS48115.1 alpha/beta hydrolase family protein [bacterium]